MRVKTLRVIRPRVCGLRAETLGPGALDTGADTCDKRRLWATRRGSSLAEPGSVRNAGHKPPQRRREQAESRRTVASLPRHGAASPRGKKLTVNESLGRLRPGAAYAGSSGGLCGPGRIGSSRRA